MKKIVVFLCALFSVWIANAQNEDSTGKNRFSVGGELTSGDTWQMDVSYHYMIFPYVGLGASVGIWKQFAVDGIPKGNGWIINDDYEKIENIYLRPSIHFVSPTVARISDGNLKLFLEPGFMMNIPYCNVPVSLLDEYGFEKDVKNVSTHKGRWYAFDCKIGFGFDLGNVNLSGGYRFSTLDIYAMRRNLTFNGKRFDEFYPKESYLHGGFIAVGYFF